MDTATCKICKTQVSTTLKTCPVCGEPIKKPISRWMIVVAILGLFFSFLGFIDTIRTYTISDISYEEIKATVRDNSLTTAQLENKLNRYRRIRIKWKGRVLEAKRGLINQYEIWIDMDGRVQDVILNTNERTMLSVNQGDEVTFVGKITKVDKFLGSVWVYVDLDMIQ